MMYQLACAQKKSTVVQCLFKQVTPKWQNRERTHFEFLKGAAFNALLTIVDFYISNSALIDQSIFQFAKRNAHT